MQCYTLGYKTAELIKHIYDYDMLPKCYLKTKNILELSDSKYIRLNHILLAGQACFIPKIFLLVVM
jgi:hypothetical protein